MPTAAVVSFSVIALGLLVLGTFKLMSYFNSDLQLEEPEFENEPIIEPFTEAEMDMIESLPTLEPGEGLTSQEVEPTIEDILIKSGVLKGQ